MTKPLIGTIGIGAIEGVQHLPAPSPTIEIAKLAIQIVLGIATLFKMFKKPKPQEEKENINQNQ
ncbi:hypothetical protein [Flavobacterium sp.]|uniref:hypothetical protein n=1 Tax=Flavobacterium sp. TaxID=239 RepID=UPI002614622E|nr:hypothetical protein [Flavobacterium sp.]